MILQVLIDYAPGEVERHLLAQESGYSATSSSFANALGKLRSLDLVEGWRLHSPTGTSRSTSRRRHG